jgi:RNA polymerase sigma factor (sigma-70 family)
MDAQSIAVGRLDPRRPRVRLSGFRDEALGRLVSTGSERAFAVLYERYHAMLYRYCRSIVRHDADAQDALQATFAAAYGALRAGRRDAPLRPWLFRIAHNESITVLRQRRAGDQVPEDLAAVGAEVETRADDRERLRQLLDDLRALPERQRSALTMRELNGLSHEEIAVALSSSVAAAKQTIFEARRTLTEYAEGRAMSCDEICRMISDGDRRALRSRRVRAHVRQCASCSAFAEAIPARASDLRALAPPLPPAVAAAILARATGGAGSAGGGYGTAASGVGAKAAVTATAAKVATGVAVLSATLGAAAIVGAGRPASIRSSHVSPPARSAPARVAVESTGGAPAPSRAPAVARSPLARHGLGPNRHGAVIGGRRAETARRPSLAKIRSGASASRANGSGTTAPGTAWPGGGGSVTTAAGQSQPSANAGQGRGSQASGSQASGSQASGSQASGSSQSASAPGRSASGPAQSANGPGYSGSAPGQSGSTPGQSGSAPGLSGSAPGLSGSAPGLSGNAPGLSGSAPGQVNKASDGAGQASKA